jgi:hypothetical protein
MDILFHLPNVKVVVVSPLRAVTTAEIKLFVARSVPSVACRLGTFVLN